MLCSDPHEKATEKEQQEQYESLARDSERAKCMDKKCAGSRLGPVLFNLEDLHCQPHGFGRNVKVFTYEFLSGKLIAHLQIKSSLHLGHSVAKYTPVVVLSFKLKEAPKWELARKIIWKLQFSGT